MKFSTKILNIISTPLEKIEIPDSLNCGLKKYRLKTCIIAVHCAVWHEILHCYKKNMKFCVNMIYAQGHAMGKTTKKKVKFQSLTKVTQLKCFLKFLKCF